MKEYLLGAIGILLLAVCVVHFFIWIGTLMSEAFDKPYDYWDLIEPSIPSFIVFAITGVAGVVITGKAKIYE